MCMCVCVWNALDTSLNFTLHIARCGCRHVIVQALWLADRSSLVAANPHIPLVNSIPLAKQKSLQQFCETQQQTAASLLTGNNCSSRPPAKMLQVHFACNTIVSRRALALALALALFAFVAIANVAAGNAKSFGALDFGEYAVVASQSNGKLEHLSKYKCASCNNNSANTNTNIYNLTSVRNVAKTEQLLSRRKRFLAFPMGSSFAVSTL